MMSIDRAQPRLSWSISLVAGKDLVEVHVDRTVETFEGALVMHRKNEIVVVDADGVERFVFPLVGRLGETQKPVS